MTDDQAAAPRTKGRQARKRGEKSAIVAPRLYVAGYVNENVKVPADSVLFAVLLPLAKL